MWGWTGLTTAAGRRRWLRMVGVAAVAAILVVAFGPMLMGWRPVRQTVVGVATRDLNGRVDIDAMRSAWWWAPQAEQIVITPRGAEPVLQIEQVHCTKTLWGMLWNIGEMGVVQVEHPQVRLVATRDGLNLRELLRPAQVQTSKPADEAGDAKGEPDPLTQPLALPPIVRRLGVDINVNGAEVVFRGVDSERDWKVGDIHLKAAVKPPIDGQGSPEFVIAPGPVVEHADLSVGLCGDVLKFVAPILAEATHARGDISVDLRGCRVPLEHPIEMDIAGTLKLHQVEAGPGSLVRGIADKLGVPAMIELAHETHVDFEIRERRVVHHNLEFGLGRALRVRTSGTVGFDQTLDLLAEVWLSVSNEQRPLLSAMSDKPLRISIRGTFKKPIIDTQELAQSGLNLVLGALSELQQNPQADGNTQLNRLSGMLEQLLSRSTSESTPQQESVIPPTTPPQVTPGAGPQLIAPQPVPGTIPPEQLPAVPGTPPASDVASPPGDKTAEQVEAALDMATTAAQILQEIMQKRRERREAEAANVPPAATDPANPAATVPAPPAADPEAVPDSERRRPLLNMLDRLRQQRQQPREQEQPPTPPPPPASPPPATP